jgi:hypothetical protein
MGWVHSWDRTWMPTTLSLSSNTTSGEWKVVFFFFFFCSTCVWTQGLHLEPFHQPFFMKGFFEIGSHELFASGWLQTPILLISASWVSRITGMSHRHLAGFIFVHWFWFFWDRVFLRSSGWPWTQDPLVSAKILHSPPCPACKAEQEPILRVVSCLTPWRMPSFSNRWRGEESFCDPEAQQWQGRQTSLPFPLCHPFSRPGSHPTLYPWPPHQLSHSLL